MDDILFLPIGFQDKVIILVVPHLHGFKGVPMVSMGQGKDFGPFPLSPVDVVLQRHFQGNLHCHTAGIRKKAIVQVPRQPALELFGKLPYRLMGEPAQHHMGKPVRLGLNGLV